MLQHVLDPVALLDDVYEQINPSGLLIVTARFKHNYKLALPINEKYHNNIHHNIRTIGFKRLDSVYQCGYGQTSKYLEVHQK